MQRSSNYSLKQLNLTETPWGEMLYIEKKWTGIDLGLSHLAASVHILPFHIGPVCLQQPAEHSYSYSVIYPGILLIAATPKNQKIRNYVQKNAPSCRYFNDSNNFCCSMSFI